MAVNGSKYFKVTIDYSGFTQDWNNVPVYVDLSDLGSGHGFWSHIDQNGNDIRVTESGSNSEVPFEVVSVDTSNKTGELHFKAPFISGSSNTDYLIWYGSDDEPYDPTGSFGRNNVWTLYEAVYHVNDNPTSSIKDSTGNGWDLTSNGSMGSSDLVDGQVGKGLDFDGNDDYLSVSNFNAITGGTNRTVLFWANLESDANQTTSYPPLVSWGNNATGELYEILHDDNNGIRVQVLGGQRSATTGIRGAGWNHVAVRSDTNNVDTSDVFLNGSNDSVSDQSSQTINTQPGELRIASDVQNLGRRPDGILDEVRIADSSFSQFYINQCIYQNQYNTTNFYTLSSEVALTQTFSASFGISQTNQVLQTNKATSGASVSVDQLSTIQEGSAASADDALSLSQLSTILDSSKVSATANVNIDSVQSIDSNGIAITQATLSQALVNAINSDGSKLIVASFSVSSQSTISQSNQAVTDGSVNLSMQTVFSVLSNAFASADISMSSVQSLTVVGNTAKVTLTDGRTLTIKLENRTITPEKENRTNTVPGSKSRKMKIDKEDRTVKIDEENRSSSG